MANARTSAAILIAGNLIPLAGAFLLDWNAADLVTLYWIENIIIGALNVPRMLLASAESGEAQSLTTRVAANAQLTLFFLLHYGVFCAVHALVLVEFFAPADIDDEWFALRALLAAMTSDKFVVAGVVALCVSHACSFFLNYLGQREYQRVDAGTLMGRPYRRVLVVQVFAIAAGALLMYVEGGTVLVALFVLVKLVIDWRVHQLEHDGLALPAPILRTGT